MPINRAPRKAFAAAMRKFRQRKGISQEKLALEIEMDRSYVSALERGLHSPTLDTMCRVCEILEVRFTSFARAIDKFCGPTKPETKGSGNKPRGAGESRRRL